MLLHSIASLAFGRFLRNFRVCPLFITYSVREFVFVTIIELRYKSITNCSEGQSLTPRDNLTLLASYSQGSMAEYGTQQNSYLNLTR